METLIKADDHLALWAFIMVAATAAICIEQRYKWASKIPGAVMALLFAITASNLHIIPTDAPTYDIEPPRVSRRPTFLREYPNEKYLLT